MSMGPDGIQRTRVFKSICMYTISVEMRLEPSKEKHGVRSYRHNRSYSGRRGGSVISRGLLMEPKLGHEAGETGTAPEDRVSITTMQREAPIRTLTARIHSAFS